MTTLGLICIQAHDYKLALAADGDGKASPDPTLIIWYVPSASDPGSYSDSDSDPDPDGLVFAALCQ